MRIIAVFKGQNLLAQSNDTLPVDADQFKTNVAYTTGNDVNDLTAIVYEDADMDAYAFSNKHRPSKKMLLTREKACLIDLVDTPTVVQARINWANCSQDQLEEYFSPSDLELIEENTAYYNGLGSEKYLAGFVPNWPNDIIGPLVDMAGNQVVEAIFKEVAGFEL